MFLEKNNFKKAISKADDAIMCEVNYVQGICNHSSITERKYYHTIGFAELDISTHVSWSKSIDTATVLCSEKLPIFMGLTVSVLNLRRSSPITDAKELNDLAIYVPVCYGMSMQKFYSQEFRNSHVFQTPLLKSVIVSDPKDLLEFLKQSSIKRDDSTLISREALNKNRH